MNLVRSPHEIRINSLLSNLESPSLKKRKKNLKIPVLFLLGTLQSFTISFGQKNYFYGTLNATILCCRKQKSSGRRYSRDKE